MKDAGALFKFVAMPLDVFAEICRYLTPLNLLRLSRSSRSFRQLLLSKTSSPLWRTARRNVDLPDLDAGMDEAAYAAFMYGELCMRCHTQPHPESLVVDYCLRVRFCDKCAPKKIVSFDTLRLPAQISYRCFSDCVVSTTKNPFDKDDSDDEGEDDDEHVQPAPDGPWVLSSAAQDFTKRLSIAGRSSPSFKLDGSTPLANLVRELKASKLVRERNEPKLQDWAEERACELEAEKCDARREALEAKFEADGWDDNEFSNEDWYEHELVDCPDELITASWNNCKPILEAVLASLLAYRLREERSEETWERLESLYEDLKHQCVTEQPLRVFPDFFELVDMDGVKQFLDDDVKLTDDSWTQALPRIKTAVRKYAAIATKGVGKKVASVLSEIREMYPTFSTSLTQDLSVYLAEYSLHRISPSHRQAALVQLFAHRRSSAILDLIGFDESYVDLPSVEDKLNNMDEVFGCAVCAKQLGASSEEAKRRFEWRSMIDHFASSHPSTSPDKVIKLFEVEESSVGKSGESSVGVEKSGGA